MRSVAAASAALLFLLSACENPNGPPVPPPAVTLDRTSAEIRVGETTTLNAVVQRTSVPALLWRSSDTAIAVVNQTGQVTGRTPGTATITALLRSDTTVRAEAAVVVTPGTPPPPPPPGNAVDTIPVLGHGVVAERWTGEVAARGGWAYTSTWSFRSAPGNAIKIWNVSGNTPLLVDSLIIPGASTTGDVQISDDGALLVVATEFIPGSIVIFDRSNPARPVQLSRFSSPNTQPGVHTVKLGRVNGRHYAFLSVDPGSIPATLVTVDITDPRNPQEVWAQVMGRPFVHDVFVRDGILFAALWHDGFRIFDIGGGGRGGTPAAPVVIGNGLTATGQIHNIWWFHDPSVPGTSKRYVFLGEEGPGSVGGSMASGDIHVFDISSMAAPREVAIYSVPGAGTHNFWMDEASGILYAAYYNGGVRALDVRGDLGNCTAEQRTAAGLCDLRRMGRERAVGLAADAYVWGVVLDGNHLYASDMKRGLFKLDIAALRR